MHVHSTLIPALGLFAHLGTAAYTLKDDYLGGNPESFFEKFDFFTVRAVLNSQGNAGLTSIFTGPGPDQWPREIC